MYYRHHVFFCTNRRDDGSQSCEQCGASEMRAYTKERIKSLGLAGKAACVSIPPAAWIVAAKGR